MQSPDEAGVYCLVQSQAAEDLIRSAPQIFNQHMNKAFRTIGTDFGRTFSKGSRVGGIEVHRRTVQKPSIPGQPKIPAAMQAAGFRARVDGLAQLDGKRLRISTRSPVMYKHEIGGQITAKSELGMAIPFSGAQIVPKGSRKQLIALQRGSKIILFYMPDPKRPENLRGIAHYRQSITMKALLRFISTWDGYLPEVFVILDKGIDDGIRRLGGSSSSTAATTSTSSSSASGAGSFYSFEGGGMDLGSDL